MLDVKLKRVKFQKKQKTCITPLIPYSTFSHTKKWWKIGNMMALYY